MFVVHSGHYITSKKQSIVNKDGHGCVLGLDLRDVDCIFFVICWIGLDGTYSHGAFPACEIQPHQSHSVCPCVFIHLNVVVCVFVIVCACVYM